MQKQLFLSLSPHPMSRPTLLFAGYTSAFLLLLILQSCHASDNNLCSPSSCGNIQNISYPFRLKTDPNNCGNHRYTLSCEDNSTVLYLYSGKYYVQAINYDNYTIRLVDAGVHEDDCSIPRFPLTGYNFSLDDPYTCQKSTDYEIMSPPILTFISCPFPVNSSLYVETPPCTNDGVLNHYYVDVGMEAMDLMSMCRLEMMTILPENNYGNMSFVEIQRELAYGFELSWHYIYCGNCRGCYFDQNKTVQCTMNAFTSVCYLSFGIQCIYINASSNTYAARFYQIIKSVPTVLVLLGLLHFVTKFLYGTPFVVALLIYKWRRRHLSEYETVEEFLQSHNNLMPIRYSYSNIKKMTGGFKEKLGEGGFGSVYKGKLRSGCGAAIKILSKSKTNGQDFINEVATLGRIHHVNVVQLIGYCVEGSKRALVYDFMPNGSLDNYIFSREGSISLTWEKLYEISLGVARGIEYLHQGCDMQILHFDIKPHNVLLDENFIPKISDFGLAKLYATNDSMKSLTAVRGTIGYMAPELFYRNIGHVSYKADVYSFGMLLLEMAGKRNKVNEIEENSSEAYFPFWVYDEISDGKVVAGDATQESNKLGKKMVVVGLWCIQINPSNRPSMNKVIQMLEGDLDSLQLPPKATMYREENLIKDGGESTSLSVDFSESISLIDNSF